MESRSRGGVEGQKKCKMAKEGLACCYSPERGYDYAVLEMELQRKIALFRDVLDLPEFESASMAKLVMETTNDLHRRYPESVGEIHQAVEMRRAGTSEVESRQWLALFCSTLKFFGNSWKFSEAWLDEVTSGEVDDMKGKGLSESIGIALKTLNAVIKLAKERLDLMDEDEQDRSPGKSEFEKILDSPSDFQTIGTGLSPDTPTSVLHGTSHDNGGFPDVSYTPPLLLRLRVRAVGKLNPVDVNHFFSGNSDSSSTPPTEVSATPPETQKTTQPQLPATPPPIPTMTHSPSIQVPRPAPLPTRMPTPPPVPSIQVPPPPPPPSLPNKGLPAQSQAPPPPPPPGIRSSGPPPPPPPTGLGSVGPSPPPLPQAVGSVGPPPPPPVPGMGSKGPVPPPIPGAKGAPPLPPPPGAAKSLRPNKTNTKLKRSTHIGNLYRLLRGKVEGSNVNGKLGNGRKGGSGGAPAGGKQGMADALAEMTKRSAYFQQIEEDVRNHAKAINELKKTLNAFKNKDMKELQEFHHHVESILENLTDESQVLARFEEFPTKKLENLRMAAALYTKLDGVINELHSWKIEAPLGQLLDKIERYFSKIKGEMESLERVKDEESKKFSSSGIHFEFDLLLRIKEAMVDISSGIMELALKERREAKEIENREATAKAEGRKKVCVKMLWRAFQFAFKVYTFAGGHDDRADELTRQLAQEIESHPR
ncbi:hypothetical protein MLD38_012143 [Melastoma candidum]|uniref:Uncharacterized protein n=1 Tax=Melastoma candidum TaxID=119954 RepID=A0ACB9R6G4_9MYRT|nr:hypothetical protein MLD38_012143 [Melastoma candidum]